MKSSAVVVRRIPILLSIAVSSLLIAGPAARAADQPADAPPQGFREVKKAVVKTAETTQAAGTEQKSAEASDATVDREAQAFRGLKSAVMKNNKGVMPPRKEMSDRDKKWNEEVVQASLTAADLAAKFRKDFPESKQAGEAAQIEEQALFKASLAGSADAAGRLDASLSAKLKKSGLSDDERFRMRSLQLRAAGAAAGKSGGEESARLLIKEFPKRSEPYSMLLSSTYGKSPEDTAAVAGEIEKMANAPEEATQQAKGILRRINIKGQAPEIQFTALDGREVDLAKLKGKVVLVDFWATWCGPCVAELPRVKEAYDRFHDQGFEVVAISFDHDKSALEKFVKSKELPWPQYFDGKGWKNKYGIQYGIQGIPAMWLVDRQGKVAETNARDDLAGKIERLLAPKEAAAAQ